MKLLCALFSFVLLVKSQSFFSCFQCQGGFSTLCANTLPQGFNGANCTGPGAQCYESVVFYQSGAQKLVQRGCWNPSQGDDASYCKNFMSPVGVLEYCRTCTSDDCNNWFYNPKRTGTADLLVPQ